MHSDEPKIEVYAPKDIREYHLMPKAGETKEETERAARAIEKILDRAGY